MLKALDGPDLVDVGWRDVVFVVAQLVFKVADDPDAGEEEEGKVDIGGVSRRVLR